jgi:hypothetical protein
MYLKREEPNYERLIKIMDKEIDDLELDISSRDGKICSLGNEIRGKNDIIENLHEEILIRSQMFIFLRDNSRISKKNRSKIEKFEREIYEIEERRELL